MPILYCCIVLFMKRRYFYIEFSSDKSRPVYSKTKNVENKYIFGNCNMLRILWNTPNISDPRNLLILYVHVFFPFVFINMQQRFAFVKISVSQASITIIWIKANIKHRVLSCFILVTKFNKYFLTNVQLLLRNKF